jgi:predicted polyphosphate/ATP-dependent NAD kinase
MRPTGTAADSQRAARLLAGAGADAIVVLGGDGTHRAVAAGCGQLPIAGISTGTNNAFPQAREPTVTGLAAGLAVSGAVPRSIAFALNKRIEVSIDGAPPEIALVDVALVTDRYVGARALWRTETFRELFVTFADPEAIGMSSIAGLVEPIGRDEPGGMMLRLGRPDLARFTVNAPIGPGLVVPIGVEDWRRMPSGVPFAASLDAGAVALDGERELFFDPHQSVTITLVDKAFQTVDVAAVMRFASTRGLMRAAPLNLVLSQA